MEQTVGESVPAGHGDDCVGEIVDAPVPPLLEQINDLSVPQVVDVAEVVKTPLQEHIFERTAEQIDDLPVPQVVEESLEVVQATHQKRIVTSTMEQIVDFLVVDTAVNEKMKDPHGEGDRNDVSFDVQC